MILHGRDKAPTVAPRTSILVSLPSSQPLHHFHYFGASHRTMVRRAFWHIVDLLRPSKTTNYGAHECQGACPIMQRSGAPYVRCDKAVGSDRHLLDSDLYHSGLPEVESGIQKPLRYRVFPPFITLPLRPRPLIIRMIFVREHDTGLDFHLLYGSRR